MGVRRIALSNGQHGFALQSSKLAQGLAFALAFERADADTRGTLITKLARQWRAEHPLG